MNEETLEQIQTKIAFLERANTDLSDVVYRQQQEIRALHARIKEVAERLDGTLAIMRELAKIAERKGR